VACAGMNGYSLQKCLREARKEQEEGQEEGELAVVQDVGEPGTLVTLPSGGQTSLLSNQSAVLSPFGGRGWGSGQRALPPCIDFRC